MAKKENRQHFSDRKRYIIAVATGRVNPKPVGSDPKRSK